MKNIRLVLFSMLMLIIGCAAPMSSGISVENGRSSNDFPSVLIQNTGIDVLRIYENGRRIASVYPGQQRCVLLKTAGSGMASLSFGYLASRDRWFAVQQQFSHGEGWVWIIDASLPALSEMNIYLTERCDVN